MSRRTAIQALRSAEVPEYSSLGAALADPPSDADDESLSDTQPECGSDISADAEAERQAADDEAVRQLIEQARRRQKVSEFAFGDALHDIRERVEPGRWSEIVDSEFGISVKTANNRIHASMLARALEVPEWMPYSTVLALGTAKKEVQLPLLQRVNAGERITAADIKAAIQAAKKPRTQEVQDIIGIDPAEPPAPPDVYAAREAADTLGEHIARAAQETPQLRSAVEAVLRDDRLHSIFLERLLAFLDAELRSS